MSRPAVRPLHTVSASVTPRATTRALAAAALFATSLLSLAACGGDGPSAPPPITTPVPSPTGTGPGGGTAGTGGTNGGGQTTPATPSTQPAQPVPSAPSAPSAPTPPAPPSTTPSGGPQAPVSTPTPSVTTGGFAGTITVSSALVGRFTNGRVAIYRTADDRDYDRVYAKSAMAGNGPSFTFSMTGLAPGRYYVDLCAMPVTTTSCINPTPETVTITAGQTATWAYRIGS